MFNRLFSHKTGATDGLTQAQREAIVDVLHYCMYADNFIALSESEFIAAKVESFNWDPKISIDYYQNKSIGAVRTALADPKAKAQFFVSLKQRLASPATCQLAFDLCQKLFMADGKKVPGEFASEAEIRQGLGLK